MQALIDAVFDFLVSEFGQALDDVMAPDPEPHWRFTRAYLDLSLVGDTDHDEWPALWRSMVADPHLSAGWGAWFGQQVEELGSHEAGPAFEAVRFAADGLWIGLFVGITPADRDELRSFFCTASPTLRLVQVPDGSARRRCRRSGRRRPKRPGSPLETLLLVRFAAHAGLDDEAT